MRVAVIDPFSGASGDMLLGAQVDAGLAVDELATRLATSLALEGYRLVAETVVRQGLRGTRVQVVVERDQPSRDWAEIRRLLNESALPPRVEERALAVFQRLAEAEARVHGVPVERVHFHEVGAVDSIVDIVGVVWGFELLGVEAIACGPLPMSRGWVETTHGRLPVPAPATAALLAEAAAPTVPVDIEAELVTPTGAALLVTLAHFQRPAFRPERVGYGFGARELPWPNALRLWIGETTSVPPEPEPAELLLQANLDDMNPQFVEPLVERLFAAGALDVYLTPIVMKRSRPAVEVSVICRASDRPWIEQVFFEHSTTFGVRAIALDRTKLERRIVSVATRWGEVAVKLKIHGGRVIDAVPEYRDCLAIHQATGVPIREVWDEAHRIAGAWIGRVLTDEAAESR
ncbi:nickel pincer cofactor biosynthesis protein LarC [Thermomicrobium sp. 4228-Ro]|uniref:nickel pincer cofactor biosynthesis protein LarC n=1 Tax=Thermomicrobium sp. 4228-Ro TaxID=2993937 RepID=UPI002248F258|nr:nickel pincer cofactor biosynthesis protein LarC [Thermomicrobium sp. 4228-Ro]MCX2726540.1 nickel pincer cofactor biosynthesis protein LarC [Thermomicrobium sp. 4228-Ro]